MLGENNERKNTLVAQTCVLLFEWEITFLQTVLLQREPFPTLFDTINSSPSLVTKKIFMLIIILSLF